MISGQKIQAYHPSNWYPQLNGLTDHFSQIKSEAIKALEDMTYLSDNRTGHESWRVLPLLPEEEDADVIPAEIIQFARSRAPYTYNLLKSISGIKGFMFSSLAPHARIASHDHNNPYVTAIFSLQVQGEAYLINNAERKDFIEGEIMVFDYTFIHEVVNNCDTERIVLLMLLDNALLNRTKMIP